jgi:hypothetical protein
MNTSTHASMQTVTESLLRAEPTRAALEAALGAAMTQAPAESRPELECRIQLADGSGGAKCTYLPFLDRPVVHLKLDRPMPAAAWDETTRPLGRPSLHVPPAPWTAPGVRGAATYSDDVYRIDESTALHLRKNVDTRDVTDVLVIWTLRR